MDTFVVGRILVESFELVAHVVKHDEEGLDAVEAIDGQVRKQLRIIVVHDGLGEEAHQVLQLDDTLSRLLGLGLLELVAQVSQPLVESFLVGIKAGVEDEQVPHSAQLVST